MKTVELNPKEAPAYLEAIEDHEGFFLVRLKGEIGIRALEKGRKPVLCDFKNVTHSDTATLAALIKRFSELFLICETQEEAEAHV